MKANKSQKKTINKIDTKKYTFNEEFYSIPLYVDFRVLVPRNDTEILVYNTLKYIKNKKNIILIDVGTGSSCIPISIAKNSNISQIYALDISSDALDVARINIQKYNLENTITLLESNLFEKILNYPILTALSKGDGEIIITANLPYIKNKDFYNMDKEVLDNEPHIALFGGEKTGFELYEKLIKQTFELKKLINENIDIVLFIEIGFDQYDYSKKYLEKIGLKFEYFKDYNNIYRVIKIIFN